MFRQRRTMMVEGEGVDPSIVPQTYEQFQADQARPGAKGIEEYFQEQLTEAETGVQVVLEAFAKTVEPEAAFKSWLTPEK